MRIDDFGGEVVAAGEAGYERARSVWNAMVDRRPEIIVWPRDVADVAAAVRHARLRDLLIAVRCGGHSIPGHSVCDGGIVIDLSLMRRVEVDASARRARAQGGCLLQTLDAATQEYGLCVPAGAVSHTGLGGLVLGGGFGHLMRKHGLSLDNVLGAQVVLADGRIVHVDRHSHPDLFWALRGGSGNFGIVTEFELRCHERPAVACLNAVFRLAEAKPALQQWREVMSEAPDELAWMTYLRLAPELPWIPRDVRGAPVLIAPMVWAGDPATGELELESLASSLPAASAVEQVTLPYTVLQSESDDLFAAGRRNYHRAAFLRHVGDDVLDVLLDRASLIVSGWAMLEVVRLGGAVGRVAPDATAFPHRSARWSVNVIGMWDDTDDDERNIAWVRGTYDALEPFMTGGAYVNYMGGGELAPRKAAYGATWDRLAAVKAVYDPDNVFRMNHNIQPRSAQPA